MNADKMNLVSRDTYRGINRHSEWVFEYNGKKAGIDRNHDILGANYHCFVYDKTGNRIIMGNGEGSNTKWYSTLKEAKKYVERYLTGITKEQLCLAMK